MKTIHVVTEIAAPVETVWTELSTTAAYPQWNPFLTSFRGDLTTGSRLELRIEPPGGRAMTFRPTLTRVEPERRLEWLGRLLLPGLFDGRHSFDLEALPGGRTRLTQAETFSGVLVPLVGKLIEQTRAGFEAMNEALRERAEQINQGGRTR
jgi:hypothetical protein